MSVEQILGLLAKGMSVEAIVRSFPVLTASDVRAAVAYAQGALRDEIIVSSTAFGRWSRAPSTGHRR